MKNIKKPDHARPYIRAFYEKNRLRFIFTLAASLLLVPAMLIFSWMLGEVIDIISSGDLSRLWRVFRLMIIFMAVFTSIELSHYIMRAAFLRRAMLQYKSLAFKNLTGKSISAFTSEKTGRYISILTNDASVIEQDYLVGSFPIITKPLEFVATLIFLMYENTLLTLAVAALCAIPFAGAMLLSPELSRRQRDVSDTNETFVAKVKDLLSGFAVIKSFKAEGAAVRSFQSQNESLEFAKARHCRWQGALQSVSESTGLIMQLGIFFVGAYLAIRGMITAGTVLVFVNLCNSLISSIQQVPQLVAQRKAARGLIEKLGAVIAENVSRSGEAIEPRLSEAIELKNVTFGYDPEKPIFKDFSLKLEAGKIYAILGPSGCGKSTLLSLLMGSFEDYSGSVTVDGRELRDIAPDSFFELESRIDQSVFLFDDTIINNITMYRDFPKEAVEDAIFRSGLANLIAQKGKDYRVGENGSSLSGGERQRISIARALLRGTPILLLDEPTASLDEAAADAVMDCVLSLVGLTRVLVTHRYTPELLARFDGVIRL